VAHTDRPPGSLAHRSKCARQHFFHCSGLGLPQLLAQPVHLQPELDLHAAVRLLEPRGPRVFQFVPQRADARGNRRAKRIGLRGQFCIAHPLELWLQRVDALHHGHQPSSLTFARITENLLCQILEHLANTFIPLAVRLMTGRLIRQTVPRPIAPYGCG